MRKQLNLKIFLIAAFGLSCVSEIFAQYDTASYAGNFRAYNMDMWGSGGFDINQYFEFFNVPWNEGGPADLTFDFFGSKFGPTFDVHTQGDLAMGLGLQGFTTGRIDSIFYPANMQFFPPQTGTFNAGELISIYSKLASKGGSAMYPSFPNSGDLFLDYTFGANFYFNIGICGGPLGCTSTELDFGTQDSNGNYEPIHDTIFKLTTDPTDSSYAYGFADWPLIDPGLAACLNLPPSPIPERKYFNLLPLEIEQNASRKKVDKKKDKDDKDTVSVISNPFISAKLDVPFIATEDYNQQQSGVQLKSIGEDEYITLQMDLIGMAQTAAGLTYGIKGEIPVIPCVMSIQYSFFNADVKMALSNHQELTFTPEVNVILEFPSEVYYEVYHKGLLIDQNNSDSISYTLGDELRLGFPCDYNFMDLEPRFVLGGKLHNHTWDEYEFSLELAALMFKIIINKIVIIPGFSFPICFWNPFGDDWCETVTIPEVAFPETEFPLGPLWEHSIPLGETSVDWFDGDLALGDFNQVISDPFRIAPVESSINLEVEDVLCNGAATGSIQLSDTGTNAPLQYHWSSGESTRNLANKPAGEYYVRVTDAAGCVSYQGAVIKEPEPLQIETKKITHVSCFGGSDASIEIEASGGVGAIQYQWSTGDTGKVVTEIPAGNYQVTVSDDNCSLIDSTEITQPQAMVTYVSDYKEPDCSDLNNGYIELLVQGGVKPYSYQWNTLDVAKKIEDLPGGNYSVQIIDANGCSKQVEKELVQPEVLQVIPTVEQEVSCFQGTDGILTLDITGGTTPYNITWYGPEYTLNNETYTAKDLQGGLYKAKITDANGCEIITEKELPSPTKRMYTEISEKHVSCFNGSDGAINLTVYNAQGDTKYEWSNGNKTRDISNLQSGKYEVLVTDSKGCEARNNTYLLQAKEILVNDTIRVVSCSDESDGAISLEVTGGFEPYNYVWSNGKISDSIGSLPEGAYTVTITDANNCSVLKSYDLSVIEDRCIDVPNAFTPNGDSYNDTWRISNIDLYTKASIKVFTKWGELVYEASGNNIEPWDGKYKGKDLPSATYYFILDLGDGSDVQKGSLTLVR